MESSTRLRIVLGALLAGIVVISLHSDAEVWPVSAQRQQPRLGRRLQTLVVAPEVLEAAQAVAPMTKSEVAKAVRKWQLASYELEVMTRQVKKLEGQINAKDGDARLQQLWATAEAKHDLQVTLERTKLRKAWLKSTADALFQELQPHLNNTEMMEGVKVAGLAKPHATAYVPRELFQRQFNISFLLQYYKHPGQIKRAYDDSTPLSPSERAAAGATEISERLYKCTKGSLGQGELAGATSELVVNVDSRGDAAAWDDAMSTTEAGSFVNVIMSHNLHEVHGYNRMADIARGRVLVFLQDDQLPPTDCGWAKDLLALFDRWPKLGGVGLNYAEYWYPYTLGGNKTTARFTGEGVYFRDRGIPFQFVSVADYSPYGLRARAFREIGGLDEGFANEGECGIFSDYELSLRLWTSGWQVGQLKLKEAFVQNVQGSTHVDPIIGGRCWGVQAALTGEALRARYDDEDCGAIFEQVKALNGRLEKRFTGPILWEQCCKPTENSPPCSLCGEPLPNEAGVKEY